MAVARPASGNAVPVSTSCAARDTAVAASPGTSATRRMHVSCRAGAAPSARRCLWPSRLPRQPAPPSLDELVVVVVERASRRGRALQADRETADPASLTGGRPVAHFVLLVQELYRNGDEVPAFDARDRSAFAIMPSNPDTLDVDDHAATLGLSMLYVPSMRNGPELREDRGNAIISTEPLLDPFALELPLARQRRVALGAAIIVQTAEGPQQLQVVDAHLEPLSSPKTLWVFKNPRAQTSAGDSRLCSRPRDSPIRPSPASCSAAISTPCDPAPANRRIVSRARGRKAWRSEDHRETHLMGRLDYLFFKAGRRLVGIDPPPRRALRLGPLPGSRNVPKCHAVASLIAVRSLIPDPTTIPDRADPTCDPCKISG